MRLAFDLDDTLIPCGHHFPVEVPLWPLPGVERLRAGAPALLRSLRAEGHTLWVYTSSMRSPWSIRWTFLAYGVWLEGVINAARHAAVLGGGPHRHHKHPQAFGLDRLYDDVVSRPDPTVVRVCPTENLTGVVRASLT